MQTEQIPVLKADEYPGGIWYYEPHTYQHPGSPAFYSAVLSHRDLRRCVLRRTGHESVRQCHTRL